jgi:hypothetical protein
MADYNSQTEILHNNTSYNTFPPNVLKFPVFRFYFPMSSMFHPALCYTFSHKLVELTWIIRHALNGYFPRSITLCFIVFQK